jgi:Protein of unknown function (DUF2630)
MTEPQADEGVLGRIRRLVDEEHGLRSDAEPDAQRLETIRVELDQCWDLLRQRRARREFGADPDQAQVRPPNVVENYKQ